MLLIAFCIKAAVFPLSAWLPDSYPTAPAPVTAVFAGLLTKVGVYAIIRTQTLLFPGGALDDLLMWAGLATMVMGILGAVAQTDIRRMLSFTLVSHIGYMVFGIALGTAAGLAGAIFYVAHHIAIQTTLFLVAGLVERQGGSTSVDRLGGLAKRSPLLAVLFFVPAMNLAGIPPLSGFIGKLGLLEAGVADGSPLALTLVAGGVVTSLLTLLAVARVWTRAFWRPPTQEPAADTAAAAASDAGARTAGAEPAPARASGTDGQPTERQAAWQRGLASGTSRWRRRGRRHAHPRRRSVRALRPLPRVMVGATAAMVAVTVGADLRRRPAVRLHRARRRGPPRAHPLHRVGLRRPGAGGGGRVSAEAARPAAAAPVAAAGLAGGRLDPAVGHLVVGEPAVGPRGRARRHAAAPAAAGGRRHPGPAAAAASGSSGTSSSTSSSPAPRWPGGRSARAGCSRGRSCGCSCAPTPTCCSPWSPRRSRWCRARWCSTSTGRSG